MIQKVTAAADRKKIKKFNRSGEPPRYRSNSKFSGLASKKRKVQIGSTEQNIIPLIKLIINYLKYKTNEETMLI